MLKIYGSMLCPDCVTCLDDLDRAKVSYEYLDFSSNLLYLKEFMQLRDSVPEFSEIRKSGKIGIPCIVRENGDVTLYWDDLI